MYLLLITVDSVSVEKNKTKLFCIARTQYLVGLEEHLVSVRLSYSTQIRQEAYYIFISNARLVSSFINAQQNASRKRDVNKCSCDV